jgi:hypothetical protein
MSEVKRRGSKSESIEEKLANSSECVQVAVRCRPFSSQETKDKRQLAVEVNTSAGTIGLIGGEQRKPFTFDIVFPPNTEQADLYQKTAKPVVQATVTGYNGTVFAYGQTGTGKTFTMEGVLGDPHLYGIIPRAFSDVFAHVEAAEADTKYLLRASFLEIYQDDVLDLLGKDPSAKLELKMTPDGGVFVKGLSSFEVKDAKALHKLLIDGKENRKTGVTAMNDASSRSHCVFTIIIEACQTDEAGEEHFRMGKLNMVDLAGSERQVKTGAAGDLLKEGIKINLSLSALGNVIAALTKKNPGHVPYRDSTLTHLLRDSLGGNTKTTMIANIGPADYNYDETMSTLRFAWRAKSIKNKPKINEDAKDTLLREYQEEIKRLKASLVDGDDSLESPEEVGPDGIPRPRGSRTVVVKKIEKKVILRGATKKQVEELEKEAEKRREEMAASIQKEREEMLKIRQTYENQASAVEKAALTKQQILQQQQEERAAMEARLRDIESKVVIGEKIISQAEKQKQKIAKTQAALEEHQRQEEIMRSRLAEQEQEQLEIAEKFESQDKELSDKTRKLDTLRNKYQELKQEISDVTAENANEREAILESVRELTKELRRKEMIIAHFIPAHIVESVEKRIQFLEDTEELVLKEAEITEKGVPRPGSARPGCTRPITEFARIKRALGDRNPRFAINNILDLDLDMPERTTQDYHALLQQLALEREGGGVSPRNYGLSPGRF